MIYCDSKNISRRFENSF